MGYYIETDVVKEKADWLKKYYNAIRLSGKPSHVGEGYVPVCIVDNGHFEAAAIAFDPDEADSFDDKSDKRKKEWLLIKSDDAVSLCPKVEPHINW